MNMNHYKFKIIKSIIKLIADRILTFYISLNIVKMLKLSNLKSVQM